MVGCCSGKAGSGMVPSSVRGKQRRLLAVRTAQEGCPTTSPLACVGSTGKNTTRATAIPQFLLQKPNKAIQDIQKQLL
jgi:hypothetical protein